VPQSSAEFRRNLAAVLALLALAALVFTLWPGIDLWVTGRFHDGKGTFPAEDSAIGQGVRYLVWDLSIAMFCAAVILWGAGLAGWRVRGIPTRLWAFIALLFAIGPVLLANNVLKEYWGRARPTSIIEFGGDKQFTPFWDMTDQCAANCSFVSGEGSGAAALAIALVVIGPFLTAGWRRGARLAYLATSIALPAAAIVQRVVTGRHFLSDTVFAILFVVLIAVLLHRAILGLRHDGAVPGGAC